VGCVEAIASGRGIAAAAKVELAGCDAKTIFAARAEEMSRRRLIHRSARTLARLIADVKATTDCQIVVIGGSVGLAEGYLALVEHYLAESPWSITWNYWRRITAMTLDYGAALLAQGE
jgi:N-acylmannosamine kinase